MSLPPDALPPGLLWFSTALWVLSSGVSAQPVSDPPAARPTPGQEPITPIPLPPPAEPLKLALDARLFGDHRLSHNGSIACSSCHDLHTNGADDENRTVGRNGSKLPFTVLSVFNAALAFRLDWEGKFRTLEEQAKSSLENPAIMATSVDEVLEKLNADAETVGQLKVAYGHRPDQASLLGAIAIYERPLLTPGSRFDLWLQGKTSALCATEQNGYALFKSLGCVSCHQGVNVASNLYERHGIFHPLASPNPVLLRVPSLRNVAVMAPYFHDGSSPRWMTRYARWRLPSSIRLC